MVERTAHNGLVAGSNPAEPKKQSFIKMPKKFKRYKLSKVKNFIKKNPVLFIHHTLNLNSKSWNKIEKKLNTAGLKYYKLNNTLANHTLINSVFVNYKPLLSGSLCFVYPKTIHDFDSNPQGIIQLNKTMPVLAVKLNKKIYSKNQISNITTLNYKKNIQILNKTLKNFIKTPYYKFKNSK